MNCPIINSPEFRDILYMSGKLPTPHVIINKNMVLRYYLKMKQVCSFGKIYFAVKSCPDPEIVSLLNHNGCCFDIASVNELDMVLKLGVNPSRIFYGNTIKKKEDIKYFYEKGVRTYASDCINDVVNIADFAPKSDVYFRILLPHFSTADWPLSKKFGTAPDVILNRLIPAALKMNLNPIGVSFHVGSQQRDITAWDFALSEVKKIFDKSPVKLDFINMGGGFPAHYCYNVESIESYSSSIKKFIDKYFPDNNLRIVMEPGRSLTADSGILCTSVVQTQFKDEKETDRWIYIDAGKFNGLIETTDECIKYPVLSVSERKLSNTLTPSILAGPTCDSLDILYQNYKYNLPSDLQEGDRLIFLSTGAYTSSYASVSFNGFPPIKTYVF